ncbi:MAG: ThuA domain-containing protein [Candidatus Binataceae bacterium]
MAAKPTPVHVVVGGFPPASCAGHDMDFARLRILQMLQEVAGMRATVSNDFADIIKWLPTTRFMISYVAGPFLNDDQNSVVRQWLEAGGRWLALHGSSGGKAVSVNGRRQMVKLGHHDTLGCFFLNHPPLRKFRVDVTDRSHALTNGVPGSFEVMDELYLIEWDPAHSHILLTTELEKDPSPAGFGFAYDRDSSLLADGKTRVLGYIRETGKGGVTYFALGHCHSPVNKVQPFVDISVETSGTTPRTFRGSWESEAFRTLLRNGVEWGRGAVTAV